jgi:hypothetical protein
LLPITAQAAEGATEMSIVDDLVENLIERNVIRFNGTFTITLIEGGVALKGQVLSTLRDQRKNKDLLNVQAPIDAELSVGAIVVPLPQIR